MPRPVWRRRRADLALVDCNRAYAEAVDATVAEALAEGRELGAGVVPQGGRGLAAQARQSGAEASGTYHIVIAGSRRFVEIRERPLGPDGDIVGFARDLTDLENKEAELARHIAAHAEVLENIAVAIAIYGADTRLTFFNTAFARLWNLEEDWLATEPTLDEILERLRERRRLPEHADFRSFKKDQRAMFTSLLVPQEELLHLPDERTLRLVVSPHPFGGLIFAYEDVTDRLALERSYNTLIEVQRETLDNLYEGIAVFGSDGRLKLWNPAYAQMWRLEAEDLAGEPHIADVIEKMRRFYDDGSDWADRKRRIIARITAHEETNARLERRDGSVLKAVTVPLPDGNIFLSYLDVTDSTRVEEALQGAQRGARDRGPPQERVHRQRLLRAAHAAERHHRLRRDPDEPVFRRAQPAPARLQPRHPRQLEPAPVAHQRHPRPRHDRGRLHAARDARGRYPRADVERPDLHARARAQPGPEAASSIARPTIGTISADERRLKQALFNLVSNALKFTPSGGTVTLAAYRERERVALVVADTGVGVPREDQARIFEKFERGNPQARQSGPGLGLSLVKSFIELHGGEVELQSHPGTGTTVTCWLNDRVEVQALRSAGE